ncbi:MAG: DUF1559 domain-containing protein [Planctomycetaceae bacterium]|nr:DUF1559 domain-containing protein [Planctomycetaceae bacterium]
MKKTMFRVSMTMIGFLLIPGVTLLNVLAQNTSSRDSRPPAQQFSDPFPDPFSPPEPSAADSGAVSTTSVIQPVRSMVDSNTFFIGRLDLTKFDTAKTAQTLKSLSAAVLAKLQTYDTVAMSLGLEVPRGLTELKALPSVIDKYSQIVQSAADQLRDLGCHEIYLLANSKLVTVSPLQIVLIAPEENLPELEKLLTASDASDLSYGLVFQRQDNKLIANLIVPLPTVSLKDENLENRVAFLHKLIRRPSLRQELAAGLEDVEGVPFQFVFAPDGVIRGLLRVFLPFAGYDSSTVELTQAGFYKTLNEESAWIAVGFDPDQPVLSLTVKGKSPESVQKLHDAVIWQKMLLSYHSPQMSAPFFDIAMLFLPEVRGDRMKLTVDKQQCLDWMELTAEAYSTVIRPSQEKLRKTQYSNSMKHIVLAMHTYHDVHNSLPAPYTVGKNGEPLFSWRVALLPYLEQAALYEQIMICHHEHPDDSWDSECYKPFHHINIPAYQAPGAGPGMTNYSFVVGKAETQAQADALGLRVGVSTPFPGPNIWKGLGYITDGTSNTIAVVERREPVCWMDPTQEISLEDAVQYYNTPESRIGGLHKGGFFVGFLDGSVRFLNPAKNTLQHWKAALTCNGGENTILVFE